MSGAITRYPEIEVAGTPREMGRQIGEAAGPQIREFCAVALERVRKTVLVSRAAAQEVATRSRDYAEQYGPHMVDELRGIAESAHVTLDELMLLQVRNQLQADDAGCTSLACGVRQAGIVAQNWDNDPALDPFTIVLTRRPQGKPAFMNLTQAGLVAYIGFNEAGVGVCLNSLPAPSRKLGVPHYFTVRGIYETDSLEGAVDAVRRAHRAIPANIMLTTPQGPADLEVTLEGVHLVRDAGAGIVLHTNHCLHPSLTAVNGQFPELIQSYARLERIQHLLAEQGGGVPVRERIQTALRDHEGYPRSICRHANDDPDTGFWQTVFSVIIEPLERRMDISRGTPCEQAYESYHLT